MSTVRSNLEHQNPWRPSTWCLQSYEYRCVWMCNPDTGILNTCARHSFIRKCDCDKVILRVISVSCLWGRCAQHENYVGERPTEDPHIRAPFHVAAGAKLRQGGGSHRLVFKGFCVPIVPTSADHAVFLHMNESVYGATCLPSNEESLHLCRSLLIYESVSTSKMRSETIACTMENSMELLNRLENRVAI